MIFDVLGMPAVESKQFEQLKRGIKKVENCFSHPSLFVDVAPGEVVNWLTRWFDGAHELSPDDVKLQNAAVGLNVLARDPTAFFRHQKNSDIGHIMGLA